MRKRWLERVRRKLAVALTVTMAAGMMPVNVMASTSTMSTDGTAFTNPVLFSDVPDVDVIEANGVYYMISTTMHLSPGAPIMRSTDLVNWETVNYVYDILNDTDEMSLRNGKNAYGKGQWAASLRYREDNGLYYVTFASLTSGETYVYTTEDIENGPWTKTVLNGYLHDLSFLIDETEDEETRMYLVWGKGNANVQELQTNADGTVELIGEPVEIISNLDSVIPGLEGAKGNNTEGIHAYKIGDTYYIFGIIWPMDLGYPRTELCWKSDDLFGEWEGRKVLSGNIAGEGGGVAQGGVVRTVDGDWYSMLFQDSGAVGRVPVLVPFVWDEDGWPEYDLDENGNVKASYAMPADGSESSIVLSDDFYNEDRRLIFTQKDLEDSLSGYSLNALTESERDSGNVLAASGKRTAQKSNSRKKSTVSYDSDDDDDDDILLGTGSNWTLASSSNADWLELEDDVTLASMSDALPSGESMMLSAFGAEEQEDNLFKNGNMEDPDSDAWSANCTWKYYFDDDERVHDGKYSLYLGPDNVGGDSRSSWNGAGQEGISLTAGKTYELSAWIYSEAEAGSAVAFRFNFEKSAGSSVFDVKGTVTGGEWCEVTGTITPEQDCDGLTMWVQTDIDWSTDPYYLDDVMLRELEDDDPAPAPEPGDFNGGLIKNGDFEAKNTGEWTGSGLKIVSEEGNEENSVMQVTERTYFWDGLEQSLKGKLSSEYSYEVSADILYTDSETETASFQIILIDAAGKAETLASENVPKGEWTTLNGAYTPSDDGELDLDTVSLKIEGGDVASASGDGLASFYVDRVSLLQTFGDSVIENGTFETGAEEPWEIVSGVGTLTVSDEQAASGRYSLMITDRKDDGDGPSQKIAGKMEVGKTYRFSAQVYNPSEEEREFNLTIQMGPDWQYRSIMGSTRAAAGSWGEISGEFTVPGEINGLTVDMEDDNANIFFETPYARNDTEDFCIDDVWVTEEIAKDTKQDGEHDYNGSNLGLQWQWNHNPNNNNWSLTSRPGYLRLTTGHIAKNLVSARNTLTQRTYGPQCSGEIAMEISGMKEGDVAGLAAFCDKYGYIGIKVENGQKIPTAVVATGMDSDRNVTDIEETKAEPLDEDVDRIYFREDFDYSGWPATAAFYYSLDGEEWTQLGSALELEYSAGGHFMGNRFGLFNYATKTTGGYADFDYFYVGDTDEESGAAQKVYFGETAKTVSGTQNTEFDLALKLEKLPENENWKKLEVSVQLGEYLDVTDVVFNTEAIKGTAEYAYDAQKKQLVLTVSGSDVGYADAEELFATLKLKVNSYILTDTVQEVRVSSVHAAGGSVSYNTANAVSKIILAAAAADSVGKQIGNGNPLISHKFGADPWALEYDGRVYVYMSSDAYQYDENGNLIANDYSYIDTISVISSADMMNWRDEGEIPVAEAAEWANNSWAPAVAYKKINGQDKFFLYFADNAAGIGVLTADSPVGPFTDPIGRPLVNGSTPGAEGVVWCFDPAVLVDDDGSGYLYFGGGIAYPEEDNYLNPKSSRVIRLGDDMISTVGEAVEIDAPRILEDSGIHKYNGTYYYSYCTNFVNLAETPDGYPRAGVICYMTSDSPMGPFTYKGEVMENMGDTFGVGGNNHHAFFAFNGQQYVVYHARTLELAQIGDTGHGGYRSPHIDKVSYYSNGAMKAVEPTMKGAAQTADLNPFDRNEAETIAWQSGVNVETADELEITTSTKDRYNETGILPNLSSIYEDRFKVGVAMNWKDLMDSDRQAMIAGQFNSITCENEMKPDALLDYDATLASGDETAPAINMWLADLILDFAQQHGMKVRAHTLIWHSQTPRWLFTEGYSKDENAALVSREVMLKRMENYIAAVMKEVNDRYPGLVYAWDVVNEAILPEDGEAGGLRTDSLWYQTIGADYVEKAFEYARKYAADGQSLFYNDYNTYETEKLNAIYNLAKTLDDKGLIDGIGMQSHIGLEEPTLKNYENAVRKLAALGLELQVTELDVNVTSEADAGAKLAKRYSGLFELLSNMKKNGEANITSVSVWGLTDDESWLNGNGNGKNYPLLFDGYGKPKDAYFALVPSTVTVSKEQLVLTDIHNKDWTSVSQAAFGNGGADEFHAVVSSAAGGSIELHLDTPTGTLVGTLEVPAAGSGWQELSCKVSGVSDTHNLFLVFVGQDGEELFDMDSWWFEGAGEKEVTYTVLYYDWDGTKLKKETVRAGKDSTPPADPTREGYEFIGWDGTYTNVDSNRTLTAQYRKLTADEPGPEPEPQPESGLEIVNGHSGITVTEVLGASSSLPSGTKGYLKITRASAPAGIKNISNVTSFTVALCDSEGNEYKLKDSIRLTFAVPSDIDKTKAIVVLDGSTKQELPFEMNGDQITIVMESTGKLVVANQGLVSGSTGSSGSGSGSSGGSGGGSFRSGGSAAAGPGTAAFGWVFDKEANGWYYIDAEAGMKRGWHKDEQDGRWYYLDPESGIMLVGWQLINGKWYYLNPIAEAETWEYDEIQKKWFYKPENESRPYGSMYQGEMTPDGYRTGEDGAWN